MSRESAAIRRERRWVWIYATSNTPWSKAAQEEAAPAQAETFTVQIGASRVKDDADKLMQRARAAGLRPFLAEVDLGDKGTWYRVRVGSFAGKAEAEKFRKDVERELGGQALVMPAK